MKARILVWLVALFCCHNASFAQKEFVNASARLSGHPRILLQKGEEKALKKVIMKDAVWKDIHLSLVDEAGEIVKLPLNERIKTGRRLLSVSRENLRRIFILSYAYRMTGKNEFLKRAESEMLKAASFSDWNPSHFLDVGEMTMALAIGYDWLYPQLSVQTKEAIEKAIVEKGLKPSFDERYNWFVNAVHNWSQVCHAGVTYGALAIWEKEPELSRTVINRAIDKISIPMGHYAPDGAYPEGIGYWDYGTSFNAMFLSAIEKAFGTDYGLSELPGFLKTGEYILHAVTPNLKNFAYSDNGGTAFLAPTMFWFYDKTKDASILYNQVQLYKKDGQKRIKKNRLAPAMLIWGASASLANPQIPARLSWKAQGDNPVCFMRSSWNDSSAVYVGMKMGSPSVNHGHMDRRLPLHALPLRLSLRGLGHQADFERPGILHSGAQRRKRPHVRLHQVPVDARKRRCRPGAGDEKRSAQDPFRQLPAQIEHRRASPVHQRAERRHVDRRSPSPHAPAHRALLQAGQ